MLGLTECINVATFFGKYLLLLSPNVTKLHNCTPLKLLNEYSPRFTFQMKPCGSDALKAEAAEPKPSIFPLFSPV